MPMPIGMRLSVDMPMPTEMQLITSLSEPVISHTAGYLTEGRNIPVELLEGLNYRPAGWDTNTTAQAGLAPSENSETRGYRPPHVVDLLPCVPVFKPVLRPTLVAMQEWEGIVIEITDNDFVARLIDVTDRDRPGDEEATFPLTEVSASDISMLVPGAIFRWTIGMQRLPGGTKQRISQVVFRRLPAWTKTDISQADELAARWASIFEQR